jgi:hypothetical protein
MSGTTQFYGLAFFDFGDDLSSPLNVQQEIDRFTLIDRQLYAYFSVFGNGVISGWTVQDTGTLSVSIDPGVGIIQSYAVESDFNHIIDSLPANSTFYVYAQVNANSVVNRSVSFIFSLTTIFTDDSILLATVVTSGSTISSIDNTVRQLIGFQQVIADVIAHHRHDGVTSPRIDLTQEVQGELPMSRIADFDASKMVSGKLPNSVVPQIDHTTLSNIGTLTHPQLDSFAQSIQNDNIALFGEVTSINLMKFVMAMKYKDSSFDKYFENMLCIMPGITDDSFIDYDASNANIDPYSNCVSGLPTLLAENFTVEGVQTNEGGNNGPSLQIVTVPYETDADFNMATSISNLVIANGVKISPDTTTTRVVENFDTGLVGGDDDGFVNTLNTTSSIAVVYDTNAAQGPLAGRFDMSLTRTGQFTRTFSQPQDWSSYDTLNIYIQSGTASHASVALTLYDSTGAEITNFNILATNEVTTFDSGAINGYVLKSFNLSGYDTSDVNSMVFTTDTVTNAEEYFLVDTIYLTSQETLLPQGTIDLRYNTPSSVIFNSIDYDATIPVGTDLRIRVKIASTLAELVTAPYSALLASGEAFSTAGQYIQIDITLVADETLKLTPLLTAVRLTLLVEAETSGITINSAADWQNGVSSNIAVDSNGVVSMDKTNVGDIFFINGLTVNELDPYLLPVSGVTSNNMPMAPYQGYALFNPSAQVPDEYNPGREFLRGLFRPRSVYRLSSGDFLVADTGNDRIMEFTQDGDFVRGYASHNNIYDTELYALTSNYNPRLGVLFITFSLNIDVKFADLTTITLNVDGQTLKLSNTTDSVRNVLTGEVIDRPELTDFLDGSGGNFTGVADNILSVILSADKQAVLNDPNVSTVRVSITGNPSPAINATVLSGDLSGLECYVGDYMYFGRGGIWRPICANETATDRFIYCNAVLNYDSSNLAPAGIVSTIEFEKAIGSAENGTTLGSTFVNSVIDFSDILLGSVVYLETIDNDGVKTRKVLLAGLSQVASVSPSSSSSSSSGASTLNVGTTNIQKFSNFVGQVQLINMDSNLAEWTYTSQDGSYPSDAYFDEYGNVVVAESSLYAQSGRIVTVGGSGTIINLIENGLYTNIWDIRPQPGGNIFVST